MAFRTKKSRLTAWELAAIEVALRNTTKSIDPESLDRLLAKLARADGATLSHRVDTLNSLDVVR